MPRIAGIDIPKEKRIEIALTYLYGVGKTRSQQILKEAGVSPDKRAKDLDEHEVNVISRIIQDGLPVEGDLKRQEQGNIKRLIAIGTYRGSRHKKNLPVRGQRTRTNARTRKGPRKTVGAFKDKAVRKPAEAASGKE
ncbi:MAG: 30S ribosomal protein S13 [Candidatus Omnitrophica bacterium]|nr:30S ribosomal protein S13 [Candidatus Omnitrophota bacterium]